MPGKVYRLVTNGKARGLVRVSTGPGNSFELTPLSADEMRWFDWSTLQGVIEWRT